LIQEILTIQFSIKGAPFIHAYIYSSPFVSFGFSLIFATLSSSLLVRLHQEKGRSSLALPLVLFNWNCIKEEVLLLSHESEVGEFYLLFSFWFYYSCLTTIRRSSFLFPIDLYVTAGKDQSSSLCAFGCSNLFLTPSFLSYVFVCSVGLKKGRKT
jgi:hypothetical protein